MKHKLEKLLAHRQVRLVYPIPCEQWITKQPHEEDGPVIRRKSPKHCGFDHVFDELVSFPQLLMNPNFSLELLLVQEEEVRRYDGVRGWRRRGWVTEERRLLKVVEQRVLLSPADMFSFIPHELSEPFTTSDLATAITKSRRFAQKMVYCLRVMGCITPVGKRANSVLYARSNA
jgi:hypothetical protein